MATQHSLFEFLERTGKQVRVYDIGRRIGLLPRDRFLAFEHAEAPYPRPWQRQAWIGLVQTGDDSEPIIWFLRLHLDEQGLLVPAERDYLLDRLLAAARADAAPGSGGDFLQDNPVAFTPREDRMALFHALLSHELGLEPSRFFQHASEYFGGRPGWDQWGFVGYQGIADVACRGSSALVATAIPHLPSEPLIALGHCLESRVLEPLLLQALSGRLSRALAAEPRNLGEIGALIRAISANATHPAARAAMVDVLATTDVARSIEVLATIAGRAWEALADEELLDRYLARLVDNDAGQSGFNGCIGDLLSVPDIAPILRGRLRDPNTNATIRSAFGAMLQSGR